MIELTEQTKENEKFAHNSQLYDAEQPKLEKRCGVCSYFYRPQVEKAPEQGQCRRYPPQVVSVAREQAQGRMEGGNLVLGDKKIVQVPTPLYATLSVNDLGCGEFEWNGEK